MAMSTDVSLPVHQEPVFPDDCVVCGDGNPDSYLVAKDRTFNWLSLLGPYGIFFWGKKVVAYAPACIGCRKQFSKNKWINTTLAWVMILTGTSYLPPIFAIWAGERLLGLLYLGTFLGLWCLSGLIKWFFPLAFGLTAFTKNVSYEFKDGSYALEFAYLNDALDQFGLTEEELFELIEQYDESDDEEFIEDESDRFRVE